MFIPRVSTGSRMIQKCSQNPKKEMTKKQQERKPGTDWRSLPSTTVLRTRCPEEQSFSIKDTSRETHKRMSPHTHTHGTKINSKQIKDVRVRPKDMKLLEGNVKNAPTLEHKRGFQTRPLKGQKVDAAKHKSAKLKSCFTEGSNQQGRDTAYTMRKFIFLFTKFS